MLAPCGSRSVGRSVHDESTDQEGPVGGLDAGTTLTAEQCLAILFPAARRGRIGPDKSDEAVVGRAVTRVSDQIELCQVDHRVGATTTHVAAVVKRGARPAVLGERLSFTTSFEVQPREAAGESGALTATPFPLTATETAVVLDVAQRKYGPMYDDVATESKLMRVTPAGFVEILAWKSRSTSGEVDSGDTCELQPVTPGKAMPPTLELACEERTGNWHDDDPAKRGITTTERVEKFRWKQGRYERR